MNCKYCGEELENNTFSCPACGEKIDDEDLTECSSDETVFAQPDDDTVVSADDDNSQEEKETECTDQLPEPAHESAIESPETSEQDIIDAQAADGNDNSSVANKMMLSIVMLSAALLAIIGFLFVDKLASLKSEDSSATTIRIISQSENITIKTDTPTEFYVNAEGTNLTYQWYVKKSGDKMWHIWKNHDKSKTSSKSNKTWDGMQVYCMITDNNRTSLPSEIITVTIEK